MTCTIGVGTRGDFLDCDIVTVASCCVAEPGADSTDMVDLHGFPASEDSTCEVSYFHDGASTVIKGGSIC